MTGERFRLLCASGLGVLDILIKVARTIAPGDENELYPAGHLKCRSSWLAQTWPSSLACSPSQAMQRVGAVEQVRRQPRDLVGVSTTSPTTRRA